MTLAISVAPALVLRGMLAQHLGSSLEAGRALDGVNYGWMQEFAEQANGLGVTFKPTVIGFGAVLDNGSAFLDDVRRPLVIVSVAIVYLALWTFAAGGIIDRYARDRAVRAHAFFAASGVYFLRFLRLGLIQWITYALLFGGVHTLLFDTMYSSLTRDLSVERTAFAIRVALYVLFALLVGACNLVFDYAKVRAVVEDRHSMISAVSSAIRFVSGNAAAAGVYFANVAVFGVCVLLYAIAAPGAGGRTTMWIAFAVGELYIVARLWIKLAFWASATSLFQSRLAHAGYVAAPEPVWPDSPSAEALARANADPFAQRSASL